jgi:crossover junction endodeoxyribonuclease RuvC
MRSGRPRPAGFPCLIAGSHLTRPDNSSATSRLSVLSTLVKRRCRPSSPPRERRYERSRSRRRHWATGALALLTATGELSAVWDMPTLNDGPAGRRTVNAPLLAETIAKSHATQAFVEYFGPRPKEGAVGAFSFGWARGVVEGVMAALGVPVTFLTPPSWKHAVGIKPGKEGAKDAARSEAISPLACACRAVCAREGRRTGRGLPDRDRRHHENQRIRRPG